MSNQLRPLRFALYLVDGAPETAAEQWSFFGLNDNEIKRFELGKTDANHIANQLSMAMWGRKGFGLRQGSGCKVG